MYIVSLMHEPSSMWSTEDKIVFPVRSYKHDKHPRKLHNQTGKQLVSELICLPAFQFISVSMREQTSRRSPESPEVILWCRAEIKSWKILEYIVCFYR